MHSHKSVNTSSIKKKDGVIMKKCKKVSIVLALMMLIAFVLPMAANAGKITITPPDWVSVEDREYRAYRIFDVVADDTSVLNEDNSYIYTLNPDYEGFETEYLLYLKSIGVTDSKDKAYTSLKDYILSLLDLTSTLDKEWTDEHGRLDPDKKEEMYDLARAIWNWSEDNLTDLDPGSYFTETGTTEGVEFTDLPAGYYVVAGDSVFYDRGDLDDPVNVAGTFAAMFTVLAANENKEIKFKADAPRIEKEVLNDYNNKWEKWTDAGISEEVFFKLTSTIPDTSKYTQYTYEAVDTMSEGLTYVRVESIIAFKADENETDVLYDYNEDGELDGDFSGCDFELIPIQPVPDAGGETKFTVRIKSDKIMQLSADGYKTIKIIYVATLNENAVIESVGNPNYVKLVYSNNPNWVWDGTEEDKPPTGETPEDDAWVYTYKLNIYKYETVSGNDVPLNGTAGFQLFNIDETKVAKFIKVDTDTEGVYYYIFNGFTNIMTKPDDEDDPSYDDDMLEYETYLEETTLYSRRPDGMIYILGIDAGEYLLVEVDPPEDYNAADPIKVSVYNVWKSILIDPEDDPEEPKQNIIDDLIAFLNENRGKTGDEIEIDLEVFPWVTLQNKPDSGGSLADATYGGGKEKKKLQTVWIYNGKGPKFPETGGIGTIIFYFVSGILTAGLVTFFIIRRRRNILNKTTTTA